MDALARFINLDRQGEVARTDKEIFFETFWNILGTYRRECPMGVFDSRQQEVDMDNSYLRAAIAAAAVGMMGSAALAAAPPAPENGSEAHRLLVFHSMYGVDGPFVGNVFPQRGIPGDELPWTVASASGWLDTDGHLTLHVRGLVFTDDKEVPPNLRGTNDEPTFRAAISCITEKGERVIRRNVITAPFPATPSGDARVRTTVKLPNPCAEPTLFVLAGSEFKWFAVVGFEDEEEDEEE